MAKRIIVLMIIILILTFLTSCGQAAPTTAVPPTANLSGYPPPPVNPTLPSDYPAPPTPETNPSIAYPAMSGNGLQVIASDGTTKTITLAELNDLPKTTVESESGPKLIDVLQFASIFDFSEVTVTGSNGTANLTKDKVTDQVILSLANNTITLIDPATPSAQWIKDIDQLAVK